MVTLVQGSRHVLFLNKMKRLLITMVVFAVIVIIPIITWQLTYIDEIVSAGEKYGFMIGENKLEVFSRIKLRNSREGWVAIQVGTTPKEFNVIQLEYIKFNEISRYNSWVILYDSDNLLLNSLKLRFENNKLYSMHRHKQLFEFP